MSVHDIKPAAITIQLDKPRLLLYDLNSFSELEEVYGSMDAAFKAMQTGSMKAARTLLWAGLLHEDESITIKQVGAMVTMQNLEAVMDTISKALLDAMPSGETETQEAAPADPI